ncbi:MAG: hypothetical protein EHM45_02510 [Desulfobacteraceae bacterium]|nr:MAG: hypothetical protein EHM45_02510 [Desulfobacteraceae bacterium]
MEQTTTIHFDDEPVRFTPDGKVAVLDAIRMLYCVEESQTIWERMKTEYPDILNHCEDYSFNSEGAAAVIDKEGWNKIWTILPQYLS